MQRRLLLVGFALALLHLLATAFQRDAGLDLPWHLVLGQELLDTGRIPRVDRYSYTHAGVAYGYLPWLAELALGASYRVTGGLLGPMLLRAACLLGGFFGLFHLLRRRGVAPLLALCVLLLAFEVARPRLQLRPEVFLPPFWAAALYLLWRSEEPGGAWAPFALAPLCCLFANVHLAAAPLLLLPIAVFAGLHLLVALRARRRPPLGLLIGALLAAAATAVNPFWMDPLRALLRAPAGMMSYIQEYARTDLATEPPLVGAYLVLSALALLGGARRAALFGPALSLIVAVAALRYRRIVGPYALLSAPFVAEGLQELARRLPAPLRARWTRVGTVGLACLLGFGAYGAYGQERLHRDLGPRFHPHYYPVGAADFLARTPLPGRMFNEYNFGGYLMLRLGPERPVFIDGRTGLLYGERFFVEVWGEAVRDARAFQALCARYGIGHAVLRPVGTAFSLLTLPGWELVYFDDQALVYSQPQPRAAPYRHLDPTQPDRILLLVGDAALGPLAAELTRAARERPDSVLVHSLQAAVAAAGGDEAGLRAALSYITQVTGSGEFTLLQATVLLARGRYGEALQRLEAASGDRLGALLRARALVLSGGAEARAALLALTDEPEAQLMLAELAERGGEGARAAEHYRRFLEQSRGNPLYAARAERARKALVPGR